MRISSVGDSVSSPPVRQYSSASNSSGARSSVSPFTRGGTVSSRSTYSTSDRRGFVDRVVGGLIQARVLLVEDRRDLDEALGDVGLLTAPERDDCELAQQCFAVAVGPAGDAEGKVDENHSVRRIPTHRPTHCPTHDEPQFTAGNRERPPSEVPGAATLMFGCGPSSGLVSVTRGEKSPGHEIYRSPPARCSRPVAEL